MTFGDAIATCFRKYVDFNGRASRPEYWWFFLFGALVYLGASILTATIGDRIFLVLTVIALWLPLLAAAVRRLHDAGMSGWWWFTTFIPVIGLVVLAYLLVQRPQRWDNKYGAYTGEQVPRTSGPPPRSPDAPASLPSRLDGHGTPQG